MVYYTDGKTVKGVKLNSVKSTVESSLGKYEFIKSVKIPGREEIAKLERYPEMRQFYFGITKKKIYDVDFNNFFLYCFRKLLEDRCYKGGLKQKLNRIIKFMSENRDNLKKSYIIAYSDKKIRWISDYFEFPGYGDNKITARKLLSEVKSFTDDYISLETAEEIIEYLTQKYSGYFYLVNRYKFYKYRYLAGIGWIKHHNEYLWWEIMYYAWKKLSETYRFLQHEGVTVYNVYVDSIQTDTDILKKYPELFEDFPAKLDKSGYELGLLLPPLYWIKNSYQIHKAQWLSVDAYRYFGFIKHGVRNERINIENCNLIYLKNFCHRVGHPLADYIEYDTSTGIITTYRLPRMYKCDFRWDFCKIKTEDITE